MGVAWRPWFAGFAGVPIGVWPGRGCLQTALPDGGWFHGLSLCRYGDGVACGMKCRQPMQFKTDGRIAFVIRFLYLSWEGP